MEVRRIILKRTMLSVAELIVKSVDKALMPASVAVIVGNLLRTSHRKEVRLEVMLSLVLIHRMQQQPSILRGTRSTP